MKRQNGNSKAVFTLITTVFLMELVTVLTFAQARSDNYERITIVGENANKGIYDPSVEYNQDGSIGWLVYCCI